MSQNEPESVGREVGRKLVRVAIAVVGLLLMRVVIDALPMLKNAEPIVLGPTPQELATAFAQHTSDPRVLQEYLKLLTDLAQGKSFDLRQYPNLQAIGQGLPMPAYIFPIAIANAIVDTLIFIVLVVSALGFKDLIRVRSQRLPDGGTMLLLATLTVVIALANRSYAGVIPPLLGSQADLYNWFFLVLVLAPVVGLIVVASRNLDALTDEFMAVIGAKHTRAVVLQPATERTVCAKCGHAVEAGVKFCANCGAPATTATSRAEPPTGQSQPRACPSCGHALAAAAKFCANCGAAASTVSSPSGAPVESGTARSNGEPPACPKCGRQVSAAARFCPKCGTALKPVT